MNIASLSSPNASSHMVNKRILQIVPADGQSAAYWKEGDGITEGPRIELWALLETYDADADGREYYWTVVEGMGRFYSEHMDLVEDVDNFAGYGPLGMNPEQAAKYFKGEYDESSAVKS